MIANENYKALLNQPCILVLVEYYLPGFKAGGTLRTVSNMVEQLGDEFEFYIITRDRDFTEASPYASIQFDQWNAVGKAKVRYLKPQEINLSGLRRHIHGHTFYNIIYLNSYFAPLSIYYLILRQLRLLPRKPFIIAPRGEFSPGALTLKSRKKRWFIRLAKQLNLYQEALWQASSVEEYNYIVAMYPQAKVQVAPDLAAYGPHGNNDKKPLKIPGSIRVVFLARITPVKNLHLALDILSNVEGQIEFDIFGPIDDRIYWQACQTAIQSLPSNIRVKYLGVIPHEEVFTTLLQYHLLLLPTRGENFGHAILEALSAGCIVLISNQTPWHNLDIKGIGWDLSLDSIYSFQQALQQVVNMADEEFQRRSQVARLFSDKQIRDQVAIEVNRRLFAQLVEGQKVCAVSLEL
ncbi:MAG: glycosyl transferase family 1 [Chloroflexi bacterium]|nr:glycosyl transferase family 1 [Chloroflexota bacterium]